ncbi:DUF3592 domain-containing protein [Kocuria rosea]|uniref:DUF3592 domain-containing protein n=1 Tax=Kocuria rosea TaxID=1275 RepID=A0A4R5Y4I3_KOCRO|nr:DUF3592 domain-containing protein [Kocuria rosea]TDL38566.1 DUF3592 domain-containing protein [Kocuria rosea]
MSAVLYAVWVLFVAGAAGSIVHTVRKSRRHERLTAHWPRAEATVTGSRAGWTSGVGSTSRSRRFWPTYRFADLHGTAFTGTSEISCGARPVPGTVVEVAYNPEDPTESIQVSNQTRVTLGCLIPFFVVFAAVLFWFITVLPLP